MDEESVEVAVQWKAHACVYDPCLAGVPKACCVLNPALSPPGPQVTFMDEESVEVTVEWKAHACVYDPCLAENQNPAVS
jgi:hypothetical protein